MTLLITGFSAFPGAPANPTEALARSLDGGSTRWGEALETAVVPVDWQRAWPFLEARIRQSRPRAVLMFGLHRRAERLRIELIARNRRELGRQDAAGGFPSGPAVMDGPERLEARYPDGIAGGMRAAKVDFEWSRDAGGYLCNDSFYRLAFNAERLGVGWYGFVHTPLTDELVSGQSFGEDAPRVFCSIAAATLQRAALALALAVPAPAA